MVKYAVPKLIEQLLDQRIPARTGRQRKETPMFEQINQLASTASTALNDALDERQDLAASVADGVTEANERVLDAVIDGNRRVVDIAVTTADRVAAQLPSDVMPQLLTPAEAGARYLDFVERAVALNREMNERVVDMLRSSTQVPAAGRSASATKASTTKASATKASTTKASTKKAGSKKADSKRSVKTTSASKTATTQPRKRTATS